MKFQGKIGYDGVIKPINKSDFEVFQKIPKDTEVEVSIVKKRNSDFHRKGMALFNFGYNNQQEKNEINNFDHYRKWLTIKAGFYVSYQLDNGVYYEAESLAFNKMDDIKFKQVYNKVLDKLCLLIDLDNEQLKSEILKFIK